MYSIADYATIADPVLRSVIFYLIGACALREGLTEKGSETLEWAITSYLQAGDTCGAASCMMLLADRGVAPTTSVEALNCILMERAGDSSRDVSSETFENRFNPDHIQPARKQYQELEEKFKSVGAARGVAAIKLRYAYLALLEDDHKNALVHYDEAIQGFADSGDCLGLRLAQTHAALAKIGLHPAMQDRDVMAAVGSWGKSDGSFSYALGLGVLASRWGWQMALRKHDLERARACFRLSRCLFESLDASLNVAQSIADVAYLDIMEGDRLSAAANLERAFEIILKEACDQQSELVPIFFERIVGLATSQFRAADQVTDPDAIAFSVQALRDYIDRHFSPAKRSDFRERLIAAFGRNRDIHKRVLLQGETFSDETKASLQTAQADFQVALALGRAQTVLEEGPVVERCYRAKKALESGDPDRAELLFREAEMYASRAYATSKNLLTAVVQGHRKNFPEAAEAYRKFVAEDQDTVGLEGALATLAAQGQLTLISEEWFKKRANHIVNAGMFTTLRCWQEGLSELRSLESIADSHWWRSEENPWHSLALYGRCYEGLGNYEASLTYFRDAIAALEQAWKRLKGDHQRILFASLPTVRNLPFQAARIAMRQHLKCHGTASSSELDQEVFECAQRGRSRSLLELVMPARRSDCGSRLRREIAIASGKLTLWRTIATEIRQAATPATGEQRQSGPSAGEKKRSVIQKIQDRMEALESDIERASLAETSESHHFSADVQPRKSPTLSSVSNLLDHSAIVEYALLPDDLLGWSITRQGMKDRSLRPVSRDDLSRQIASFRASCTDLALVRLWMTSLRKRDYQTARDLLSDLDARGSALATELLTPFTDTLRCCSRLIVVPHADLHELPIACLPWQGQRLIDSHVLSSIPSASLLRARRTTTRRRPRKVVLISCIASTSNQPRIDGDALEVENWCPELRSKAYCALPWSSVEVREIARLYQGVSVIDGTLLNKKGLTEELLQADVIHIAAHGEVLNKFPLLSSIILSNRESLALYELLGSRLSADLVVLGCCHSGEGTITAGDDFLGFERVLLAAGVNTAILSLWEASDFSTMLMMRRFQKHYREGVEPASALRSAQLWLKESNARQLKEELGSIAFNDHLARTCKALDGIEAEQKPFAHPYFWAPFVCVSRDL